ncbi:MAG: hypothetical protein KOO69_02040 [Victivallales bacterium]|nr:hypothetical protein [Victivallales bacterium]
MNIEDKIRVAIGNKQLKLVADRRKWRKYYISIVELVWARNLWDGYEINIYTEEYGRHLGTVKV